RNQRPSTGSTLLSAAHTTRLSSQRKKLSQTEKSDFIREQNKREKSIESNGDHRTATEKELSREKNSSLSSSPLKPYFHDV
ncbi:unnamed protein product, partial [Rotaria socialis]